MNGIKLDSAAGFKCDACGLVFKDNIKYLDHTRTKQHQSRTGEGPVKPATLADVRSRIEQLAREKGLVPEPNAAPSHGS